MCKPNACPSTENHSHRFVPQNQQGIRHGKEDGTLRRMHTNAVVERGQEGHLQPGAEDADSVV